jgi:hypothetical protein
MHTSRFDTDASNGGVYSWKQTHFIPPYMKIHMPLVTLSDYLYKDCVSSKNNML